MSRLIEELNIVTDHHYYVHANNLLSNFLKFGKPGNIFYLEGPCGSGKKTVIEDASIEYLKSIQDQLTTDRQKMPIIITRAKSPVKTGNFIRCLFDDIIESLIIPPNPSTGLSKSLITQKTRANEESQKKHIEILLHKRKTDTLIITDLHHCKNWDSHIRKKGAKTIDLLHSIAASAKCKLVITGEYGTIKHEHLSLDSSSAIKFERLPTYLHSGKALELNTDLEDYEHWLDLLESLDRVLNDHHSYNLMKNNSEIFAQTLGCPGLLFDWLKRAASAKLHGEAKKKFSSYFKESKLSAEQRRLLSRDLYPPTIKTNPEIEIAKTLGMEYETPVPPTKKGGRVGVNNINRDQVGTG